MPRPVHFEIQASDVGAVRTFYEDVFGWTFEKFGDVDYWVINSGDEPTGVNGGLLPRNSPAPKPGDGVNAYVAVIGVGDCQEYFDRAISAGGTEAMPVTAMPGVGVLAYVKDPDGNLFGIIEPEPRSG